MTSPRVHYFRPVVTMVEREDGGYDTYIDFRDSYYESTDPDAPGEYIADDDDLSAYRASLSLTAWVRGHADYESGSETALRFTIEKKEMRN